MAQFTGRRKATSASPAEAAGVGEYAVSRRRMVAEQLMARGIRHQALLHAMLKVPRHLFVEEGMSPMAYNDRPLHIGQAQTLSHPFIVATMLEVLELKKQDRVLEIGTGSGYQTAVLAELVHHVYSMERLSPLLLKARNVLKNLAYKNITLKLGDGSRGWLERAPFDAMVISAASPQIPHPYLEQLAEGGRLVVPVGDEDAQQLVLLRKKSGRIERKILSGCRFVKLKGKYGFQA